MFSGLERGQSALRRRESVAWAWIKARGILENRPEPAHPKRPKSPLLTSVCPGGEDATDWRKSLAAITYRNLARQLCDQFYDLSVFQAWHDRGAQGAAVSRMIIPALPSYCRDEVAQQAKPSTTTKPEKARILASVLPAQTEQRSGVLIFLKSKAA
jgi:hypothetical protein